MTPNELMLTAILDCPRIDLYTQQILLQPQEQKIYEDMQARYANGEPLQYVIGFTEFYGCKIFVNPQVLIPRPETEIMVDNAVNILRNKAATKMLKVLDIGTGSGNIAISIAKYIENIHLTAIDVSPLALTLARQNAHFAGMDKKIEFICEDMKAFLNQMPNYEKFDMIIANPPYIPTDDLSKLPEDVKREPRLALDGGADGLQFYRYILDSASQCLSKNGALIFEIGDGQAEMIKTLMPESRWGNINTIKDYVNTDRIISAVKNASLLQTVNA